jgi:hypothetical protein
MPAPAPESLRRLAYGASALLASAYALYVVALKLARPAAGGPLGEVGEFLLVLACVSLFAVGLFADEHLRRHLRPARPLPTTPPADRPPKETR